MTKRFQARNFGMDPTRDLHTGQQPWWWLHQQAGHTEAPEPAQPNLSIDPLESNGAFSNRASFVNLFLSPSGSWFSSRSAWAAAASGPVGKARALQGLQRA